MSAVRLESALQRLSSQRPSVQERRRFRRLTLVLGGRMMDSEGRESDCRTEDVSPGDARITASAELQENERVVIYLDEIGRVSGHVARKSGEREYAVIFDMSEYKREKLAEKLTWIITRERLGLEPDTRIRIPKEKAEIELSVEGGGIIIGEVADFSLIGMSIKTRQHPPQIGAWVRFGGIDGRVARFIEGGFAVDFESKPKS